MIKMNKPGTNKPGMNKRPLLLIALVGVIGLSGCAVYPVGHVAGHVQYQGQGHGYGDNQAVYPAHRRDRDGDGVRNRYDRQPNNPYRY